MGQAIPKQHPAVVLRSHYTHLRALVIVLIAAVVALSVAVAILATHDESQPQAPAAAAGTAVTPIVGMRYDGGPEEGSRGPRPSSQFSARTERVFPGPRFGNGGIGEGTRGSIFQKPVTRYDGGPEEGTRGVSGNSRGAGLSFPESRYDGGPDEGTRGAGH